MIDNHPTRDSVLKRVGIDILQIVIGVIIARIVVVWMDVYKRYINYKQGYASYDYFLSRLYSASIVSCVFILISIMIFCPIERIMNRETIKKQIDC